MKFDLGLKVLKNEINEEIENEPSPIIDIMNGFSKCGNYLEIIDNFKSIRKHINMFGITKEFLHLVNSDNQLSNALNITLPYYEDDNDEIDLDNLPGVDEELIPSMEGLIGDAKDNIVKFFKWLKEKIVNFFKWLWDKITFKKKAVEDSKIDVEKIKKEVDAEIKTILDKYETSEKKLTPEEQAKINKECDEIVKKVEEAIKNKKAPIGLRFFNKETAYKFLKAFEEGFDSLSKLKINPSSGEIENFDVNTFLKWQKDLQWNGSYNIADVGFNDTNFSKDLKYLNWRPDHAVKRAKNNKSLSEQQQKEDIKDLGYSGIDDYNKIADEILKISDKFKNLKNVSNELTKVCNENMKTVSNDKDDNVVSLADIKRVKHNTQELLKFINKTISFFDSFVTRYYNSNKIASHELFNFFMSEIKGTLEF